MRHNDSYIHASAANARVKVESVPLAVPADARDVIFAAPGSGGRGPDSAQKVAVHKKYTLLHQDGGAPAEFCEDWHRGTLSGAI